MLRVTYVCTQGRLEPSLIWGFQTYLLIAQISIFYLRTQQNKVWLELSAQNCFPTLSNFGRCRYIYIYIDMVRSKYLMFTQRILFIFELLYTKLVSLLVIKVIVKLLVTQKGLQRRRVYTKISAS
jgi:hypothetical protein